MGNGWRCTERRWKCSRRAGTDGSKPRSARGVATHGWAGMTASGLTSQQLLLMLALEVQRGHVVEHQRRAAVLDGVAGSRPRPAGRDSPTRRPAQALVHRGRCAGVMPRSARTRALSSIEVGSTSPARTGWKNPSARTTLNPNSDHAAQTTSTSTAGLLPVTTAGCIATGSPKSSIAWSGALSLSQPAAINAEHIHPKNPSKPAQVRQVRPQLTRLGRQRLSTHDEGKGTGRLGNVKPQHFVAIAHGCSSRV